MALAAKSMGYPNEKMGEFIKLVGEGKIQSREFILNFSKTLRDNVRETGALPAALKTVNTARSRLMVSFQEGISEGFTESASGITDFFNTLSRVIADSSGIFKTFGSVIGTTFKILATAIDILSPVLFVFSALLDRLHSIFTDAMDMSKTSAEIGFLSVILRKIIGAIEVLTGVILILLSYVIELTEFLGDEENGLSFILDGLAVLFAVTLAGGILKAVSALSKFLGLSKKVAKSIPGVSKAMGGAKAMPLLLSAGSGFMLGKYINENWGPRGEVLSDSVADWLVKTDPLGMMYNQGSSVSIDKLEVNTTVDPSQDPQELAKVVRESLVNELSVSGVP